MPRFEILDPEAITTLERGWKRILTDVGISFDHPEALALFRSAGQRVDGDVVFLDPELVLEQVGRAPAFPQIDSPGGVISEPGDRPLDSRHLDMTYALQTLSDKPYFGSVTAAENARDSIRMTEILHGGREQIEAVPALLAIVNVNS